MIHMSHGVRSDKESGVVSILTVIFFMIFVSIITVGFVKIVNDDQSQSTDHDLSASALLAAQSGAEDGKRLLALCRAPATQQVTDACQDALNNTACSAVTGSEALTGALGVDIDTSGGRNDGIVSGNDAYEQRYTCMTIQTLTDSVEDVRVEKNTSELIPLQAVGGAAYNNLRFSWHAIATDRDGPLNAFRADTLLPQEQNWRTGAGEPYAALMRLEFIAYRKDAAGFLLSDLEPATRTVFVVPGAVTVATTPIEINSIDRSASVDPNNLGSAHRPYLVRCDNTQIYACSVRLNITGVPSPSTHSYFVRVSAIYRGAHIKAQLYQDDVAVQFDNVQPIIDVTGRANDVFRRVQTRVQFDSPLFMPQYVLEAGQICKNMLVTDTAANSADFCNPAAP